MVGETKKTIAFEVRWLKQGTFMQQIKQLQTNTATLNQRMSTFGKIQNRLQLGVGKFKMELLGLLFFGMAIQRLFLGLLRPAAELVAIFDLWRITLQIFFLPIMTALLPLMIEFMTAVLDLDEGTQKTIGAFVLLAGILGMLLFLFGTMGLGVDSLIRAWPFLTGVVESFISLFSVGFLVVAGVVIALALSIIDAWKKDFGGMKGWIRSWINALKTIFNGLKDIVQGIMDVVYGIFTGDFELVKTGVKKIWDGLIYGVLLGTLELFLDSVAIVGLALLNLFSNAFGLIGDGWSWTLDLMKDKLEWFFGVYKRVMLWMMGKSAWFFDLIGAEDTASKIRGMVDLLERVNLFGSDGPAVSVPQDAAYFGGGFGENQQNFEVTINNDITITDLADLQRILDERDQETLNNMATQVAAISTGSK